MIPCAVDDMIHAVQHRAQNLSLETAATEKLVQWWSRNYVNWVIRNVEHQPPYVVMPMEDYVEYALDLDDEFKKFPEGMTEYDVYDLIPKWSHDGWVLFPSTANSVFYLSDGNDIPNLNELLDYSVSLAQSGQRFDRMTVEDMVEGSIRWHKREIAGGDARGEEVMVFPDGMKIVRITTTTGLDFESQHCHHCVGKGTYDAALIDGTMLFYSLRDSANKPHVTIAVTASTNVANQIQGPFNKPPEPDMRIYLRKFFDKQGIRLSSTDMAVRVFGDDDA